LREAKEWGWQGETTKWSIRWKRQHDEFLMAVLDKLFVTTYNAVNRDDCSEKDIQDLNNSCVVKLSDAVTVVKEQISNVLDILFSNIQCPELPPALTKTIVTYHDITYDEEVVVYYEINHTDEKERNMGKSKIAQIRAKVQQAYATILPLLLLMIIFYLPLFTSSILPAIALSNILQELSLSLTFS